MFSLSNTHTGKTPRARIMPLKIKFGKYTPYIPITPFSRFKKRQRGEEGVGSSQFMTLNKTGIIFLAQKFISPLLSLTKFQTIDL